MPFSEAALLQLNMQDVHESQSANDELLTVDEVCEILKVSRPTVYRMVESRAIGFCRYIRFRRSDIDAYIADCLVRPINEYERQEDS